MSADRLPPKNHIESEVYLRALHDVAQILSPYYDHLRQNLGAGVLDAYESATARLEQAKQTLGFIKTFSRSVLPLTTKNSRETTLSRGLQMRTHVQDLYTAQVVRAHGLILQELDSDEFDTCYTIYPLLYEVGAKNNDNGTTDVLLVSATQDKSRQNSRLTRDEQPDNGAVVWHGRVKTPLHDAWTEHSDALLRQPVDDAALLAMRPAGSPDYILPARGLGMTYITPRLHFVGSPGDLRPESSRLPVRNFKAMTVETMIKLDIERYNVEGHMVNLALAFGKTDTIEQLLAQRIEQG